MAEEIHTKPAPASVVEEVHEVEVADESTSTAPAPRNTSFLVREPEPDATPSNSSHGPLPLPAPSDAGPEQEQRTTTVEVNGMSVALDHLGPTVVGRDGTLSRIANWPEMTAIERENTLRVLGKRNQLRLAGLRADKEQGKQQEGQGSK